MKVLEYNYKTSPEVRSLAFTDNDVGDKLLADILKARNDKVDTLLINGNGKNMLISPCEILELVLKEVNESEIPNGIQIKKK